jgi:hypothetical protein
MGRATGLMSDVRPGQCFDLSTCDRLDQKALAGMTGLTLVENVQRQTKSSRHDSLLFFLVWSKRSQPSKCLVDYLTEKQNQKIAACGSSYMEMAYIL